MELIMKYFVLKLSERIDVNMLCVGLGALNRENISGEQLAKCVLRAIVKDQC